MWSPKTLTPEQQQERRLAAARLLQSGQLSQAQVAREIGVSRQSVSRWAQQFMSAGGQAAGQQALCRRPHTGRIPSLDATQWQEVLATLRAGAQASSFPTERWTLDRIQSVISGQFGVRYNAHYLSERLHTLGWSVQVPEVTARERNEELVQAWLREDWPRIKKSASFGGADRLHYRLH